MRPGSLPCLLALGFAFACCAPAIAQPATTRTPNLDGPWTPGGGNLFFSFLHRFQVGPAPDYAVANVPTFHLSGGLTDWWSVGALYATETRTITGASQELEFFTKQAVLDEATAPLSLSVTEAFNTRAWSADAEVNLARHWGPVGVLGALRGMSNYQYAGHARAAVGLGLTYAITPGVLLAVDAATLPWRDAGETALTWGAGLQLRVPSSPHTLSLQVTNTGTDTIQGASVDAGAVRYGFDFTVPFGGIRRWFEASKPATGEKAPEGKALFAQNCATCHGAQGQGGFGPNLTGVEAKGDDFIRHRILEGSPKGMPPFKGQLTDAEVAALIDYVKQL